MKKTVAVALLVIASVLIAQAETKTVEGLVKRSEGGSRTFILVNPSIDAMENTVYTVFNIQNAFEKYEGKQVRVTGDFIIRPRGDTAIKSVDSIEEIIK